MDNLRFGIDTSLAGYKRVSVLVGQRQFPQIDISCIQILALGEGADFDRIRVPVWTGLGCRFQSENAYIHG